MTQQTQITLYQGVDVEQAAYMAAFSQPDGLQSVIDQITSQAIEQAQDLDAATATSRKKLASIAYSVAQAKTAIDSTGKDLVADAKAKIKIVDNNRKAVRDQLDNLRDQIRRPVTEFEEAEKAKQAEIQALSDRLFNLSSTVGEYGVRLTAQQLRERLQQVADLTAGDVPENIKTQAAAVQKSLEESIATAEEYEAQQAEIERLPPENRRNVMPVSRLKQPKKPRPKPKQNPRQTAKPPNAHASKHNCGRSRQSARNSRLSNVPKLKSRLPWKPSASGNRKSGRKQRQPRQHAQPTLSTDAPSTEPS